nr:odorant receptor 30 [Graphosoma rubrolineatum]
MGKQQAITDEDVIDGLSIRYLKLTGLWSFLNEYRTTGNKNAIMKLKIFFTIFISSPYIVFQYLSYFMIKVDLEKATFLNLHAWPGVQVTFKIMVFWFRIDNISRLCDLMRKDFLTLPEHKRDEAKRIYIKITRFFNILVKTSFILGFSTVIPYISQPSVSVDYLLYHTGNMADVKGGRYKILHGWYPLPIDKSPYYEAVFVYEALLLTWNDIIFSVLDSLYYQILMCLYAQFLVLGHQLSTLKIPDSQNPKIRFNENNSSIYQELCQIIKDHQKLLSYTNEIRRIYNPLLTIVLGMGICVFIIGVFQFLFGKTTPIFTFLNFMFLSYEATEIALFCFGSSLIEKASSDLQFAIYSSDWYIADKKFRKAAQMLMTRSQKAETLTALKMYPINVETMMSIMQFTYSVATLMPSMVQ